MYRIDYDDQEFEDNMRCIGNCSFQSLYNGRIYPSYLQSSSSVPTHATKHAVMDAILLQEEKEKPLPLATLFTRVLTTGKGADLLVGMVRTIYPSINESELRTEYLIQNRELSSNTIFYADNPSRTQVCCMLSSEKAMSNIYKEKKKKKNHSPPAGSSKET